jgi:hypothetical protein
MSKYGEVSFLSQNMVTLVKNFQKIALGPLQSLFFGSPSGEISPKKQQKH